MGRGADDELIPSDDELAAAEAATRRMLSRWGEPAPVPPPPALALRVRTALAQPPRRPLAWPLALVVALALVPLLLLGAWGVFGDSAGPAGLFGGASAGLGRLILGLVLAAKPLVNLLVAAGAGGLVVAAAALAAAWLWWRIARLSPQTAEIQP